MLQRGQRIWRFQYGAWVEAVVRGWEENGCVKVVAGLGQEGTLTSVPRHHLRVDMPRDCGAMVPPRGLQGVAHWLMRDVYVFRNWRMVGTAVPRPSCLWESGEDSA